MLTEVKVVSITAPQVRQSVLVEESIDFILKEIFRSHRIKSYKSVDDLVNAKHFLDGYNSALSLIERSDLDVNCGIPVYNLKPDLFLPEVRYNYPLSDNEIRKRLAFCMRQFVMPWDADVNYFMIFDNEKERRSNPDWFEKMDAKSKELLEAASIMLGKVTLEDLKKIYIKG